MNKDSINSDDDSSPSSVYKDLPDDDNPDNNNIDIESDDTDSYADLPDLVDLSGEDNQDIDFLFTDFDIDFLFSRLIPATIAVNNYFFEANKSADDVNVNYLLELKAAA